MKPRSRRWLPSPAMVVAAIALFVALAGSAVALSRNEVKTRHIAPEAVRGKEIKRNAVTTRHLRSGSVRPGKADLFKHGGLTGPVGTSSAEAVELGGPGATVTLRQPGLIAIHARAEGQAIPGGQDASPSANLHLFEPSLAQNAPRILQFETADFQQRWTAPGDGVGVAARARGGMIVLSASPGTYSFTLRYSRGGNGTASFRNVGLWVAPVN